MSGEEPIVFRSRQTSDSEGMDMTPMVDVTFLLLIFFMVTAAFAIQRSFEMPQPENSQPSRNATLEEIEQDPDYVVVRIDSYNTFHVSAPQWNDEQEAPNPVDLLIKLREAAGTGGRGRATKLLILASGDAMHECVVQAIDAGNELGLEDVQIVTQENEDFN